MTDINVFPQLDTLRDETLLLAYDDAVGGTVQFSLGQLKTFIGSTGGGEVEPPSVVPIAADALWWIEGDFLDLSGTDNHLSPVTADQLPAKVQGANGKPALRWAGNGQGELDIPFFLTGVEAVTFYLVFTVDADSSHYCLLRTRSLDDYWRFAADGNGYFGSFLSSRVDTYPASMPGSGTHLVTIKADASGYEVFLDNVSKGVAQGRIFNSGDRFRLVANNKPFKGDILGGMLFPRIVSAEDELKNLQYLKARYQSLPFTLQ